MKFFLDTANVDHIKKASGLGLCDGVTTNPSLIAREKRTQQDLLAEICDIVDGPVNGEVIAADCDGMLKEAEKLRKISENIVVKIPMIPEGLKAVKILSAQGVPTNITLVFSPAQALVAAKAGAAYVSPFVARLDDLGQVGMELVETIVTMYNNYRFNTKIIAASIRNPLHVIDAALAGVDICTIPLETIEKLYKHPM